MGSGPRPIGTEELTWWLVGIGGLAVLVAKREAVAAAAAAWLQHRQWLLPPGRGLVTMPALGALDLARMLIAAALLGMSGLAVGYLIRRRIRVSQGHADPRRRDGSADLR